MGVTGVRALRHAGRRVRGRAPGRRGRRSCRARRSRRPRAASVVVARRRQTGRGHGRHGRRGQPAGGGPARDAQVDVARSAAPRDRPARAPRRPTWRAGAQPSPKISSGPSRSSATSPSSRALLDLLHAAPQQRRGGARDAWPRPRAVASRRRSPASAPSTSHQRQVALHRQAAQDRAVGRHRQARAVAHRHRGRLVLDHPDAHAVGEVGGHLERAHHRVAGHGPLQALAVHVQGGHVLAVATSASAHPLGVLGGQTGHAHLVHATSEESRSQNQ